ncbi:MAG: heme ABC exporter ATP-binding protein CcmA [Acidobacteriota bacterium]
MSDAPWLRLVGLSKRHGLRHALRKLDLDCVRGECIGVLGRNGAGKTTLLRILAGLSRPSAGSIELSGRAVSSLGVGYRALIGHVGHQTQLHAALTARENLDFAARLHGLGDAKDRVTGALERFGLGRRSDEPVGRLSRGLRQRVAIARSLLHEPPLLLLDEPDAGLDAPSLQLLHDALRERVEQGGTVLLVSHGLAWAREVTDRVLLLRAGRLAVDRPSRELADGELESLLGETS